MNARTPINGTMPDVSRQRIPMKKSIFLSKDLHSKEKSWVFIAVRGTMQKLTRVAISCKGRASTGLTAGRGLKPKSALSRNT